MGRRSSEPDSVHDLLIASFLGARDHKPRRLEYRDTQFPRDIFSRAHCTRRFVSAPPRHAFKYRVLGWVSFAGKDGDQCRSCSALRRRNQLLEFCQWARDRLRFVGIHPRNMSPRSRRKRLGYWAYSQHQGRRRVLHPEVPAFCRSRNIGSSCRWTIIISCSGRGAC